MSGSKRGNVALLDFELDDALTSKQVDEITAYIDAVALRKAAL